MAKKHDGTVKKFTGYGTNTDMVLSQNALVVCARDELGTYYTNPRWVDSGLADPNRIRHQQEANR